MSRARELAEIVRPRPIVWNRTTRRLSGAQTVDDLRRIARRRSPRSIFDFVSGGADGEVSIRRSREALDAVEFSPRALQDVSQVDTTCTVLGEESSMPVVLAPTGFTRAIHHGAESAVARAAGRAGVPYALATMATTSVEDIRATAPGAQHWFQLYLWHDRVASERLLERARELGIRTLVVTVDTPVAGNRLRDRRNGLTLPPSLTVKTVLGAATKPSWWVNYLLHEAPRFAALAELSGSIEDIAGRVFDASAGPRDIEWLRSRWQGRLVVKGIQTIEDAQMLVDLGVDGIVVSNHGGRQLDRGRVPIEQIPAMKQAIAGRCALLVDGGFLSGSDVAAAVGLGADAVLIGRAYLYGLMAGGEDGVERALEIIRGELVRTLRLAGSPTLADLRGRVALRSP